MAEPDAVAESRRRLGGELSAHRQRAGMTQEQLAPLTLYARSTIANVEIGRQHVGRSFWARCDAALGADGALVKAFDGFESLKSIAEASVSSGRGLDRCITADEVSAAGETR